jgi:hypothetical protein
MDRITSLFVPLVIGLGIAACAGTHGTEELSSTGESLSTAVRVNCNSYGSYSSCNVDTRGGQIIDVHVTYDYSSGACNQPQSWGFGEDYVWVDHGCRAEFEARVHLPDGGAEVVLFEQDNFSGRSITLTGDTNDFGQIGFNDITSSVIVRQGTWSLCTDWYFSGRCTSFGPGQYNSLSPLGINDSLSSARVDQYGPGGSSSSSGSSGSSSGGPSGGTIIVFENENFGGRSMTLTGDTIDFGQIGFNDITSSVVVLRGVWSLCSDWYYGGYCNSFGPGQYGSLSPYGLNDVVSSARLQ